MAGPRFAQIPNVGVATISVANTSRGGGGTVVDFWTPDATYGGKLDEIVVKATDDPADSIVTIFYHNGSAHFIFDEFDLSNPAAASTTVESYRASRTYENLVVEPGHKLGAAITVALTAGDIKVFGFGADFVAL